MAHLGEQPPAPAAFGSAVAPADGRDEELAGLDLHALASADLPEHAAEPASGQAAAAAAPPAAEGSDGGTEWVTPREQLASPGMSPLAGSSGR